MTEADLSAVIALESRAFSNPWSPELIRRELTHEWSTTLLAEFQYPTAGSAEASSSENTSEKTLIGVIVFWLIHDEQHILNIATDPHWRRKGVAKALLDEALKRARQKSCALSTLEVRKSNAAAIGLYSSFGFKQIGLRANYYVDDREDAVVMLLRWSAEP